MHRSPSATPLPPPLAQLAAEPPPEGIEHQIRREHMAGDIPDCERARR
jgi:hypothetical protein